MPPDEAQAPMAITHLGSGVWSQIRLTARAILSVTVPATIMTSDCLGENRITSAPNRAKSNRAHAVANISIAQQARPIGIGQREFFRIQLMHASNLEIITLPSIFESCGQLLP